MAKGKAKETETPQAKAPVVPVESSQKEETPTPSPAPISKLGIFDDRVVVDRSEFTKLVKSLVHGYLANYQGMSMITSTQKLFGLKTFQDAKTLIEMILKG